MQEGFFKKKNIIIGISVAVLVIVGISVGVIFYQNYIHRTEVVKIENLPTEIPDELSESLETKLKNLLKNSFDAPDDAIISANMREGTYNKDEDGGLTSVSFLVDIDEYKQTYEIMIGWSDVKIVPDPILISCPAKRLMKYPEIKCEAMYGSSQDIENVENNPIYDKLPIVVDYFDYYSRKAIRYEVRGYFGENNELVLTVVDYSGGNLENAKKKVRELGYDPDNYKIKYVDQSGNF